MLERLSYSPQLHDFLKEEGYTHIQLRGTGENDNHYILFPWKDNPKTKFEESNFQMESIDSSDISDMLDLEFGIEFWVESPAEMVNKFQKSFG